MIKNEFSLKTINLFLIISLFIVFISIILSWSYIETSKIIDKSKKNYFEQSLNISKVIFEQEQKELNYISTSFAKELSLSTFFPNKKLDNLLNSNAVNSEIDIVYISYDNKNIDYSNSLFDSEKIINKLDTSSLTFNSNFIDININNTTYLLIISKKNIFDLETGRVKAKLITAKILNDDLGLIDKIRHRTNSSDIIFVKDNIFISSALSYAEFNNISNSENLTRSKEKIILDNNSYFNIIFISNNSMFNEIKESFISYTSFILFIIISVSIYLFISTNKKIVKPVEELILFSKNLRTNSNAIYSSDIKEFNNLAKSLKNTVKEVKNLKEKYSLAIDAVEDGLWDYNLLTKEIYVSKKYKEMLGYDDNDDILNVKFWLSSIHKEDLKKTLRILFSHLKKESSLYVDSYRLKCKNGNYIWIQIRGKVFFDKNNNAYRITGLHTDINEFKILQKENKEKEILLFQQAKLASMGEMIANIAHQWRQPLNHISSLSSSIQLYMQLGKFSQDDVYTDLEKINNSVEYLSLIIDKFKNYFNPNNKKEEFYLNDVIENNMPILRSLFDDKSIDFIYTNTYFKINSYKIELFQVLINLITNSIDALNERKIDKKYIFLNSYLKHNKVFIEIYDNALGIDSSLSNKIYEPYFTTKEQSQGTGIGLYMSLEIIQKHFNGKIYNNNHEFEYKNVLYKGEKFVIEFDLEDKTKT